MVGLDLGQILINSSVAITLAVTLTFAVAGLLGSWGIVSALLDFYVLSAGDSRFSNRQPSVIGAFIRMGAGGFLTVLAVISWNAADVLVGGGQQTASLFSYGAPQSSGSYCDQVHFAVANVFRLIGAVAIVRAGWMVYENAGGGSMASRQGHPIAYFVGGILTMFISDVALLLANTLGVDVGLASVCNMLR